MQTQHSVVEVELCVICQAGIAVTSDGLCGICSGAETVTATPAQNSPLNETENGGLWNRF